MSKNILFFLFLALPGYFVAQPTAFIPTGPGGGGYMYAPSINPHNHNQIYLACDMAGMYRTDDGGAHWSLLPYQQLVSHVKGKVQYTSDPNVLYTLQQSLTNTDAPLFRGELRKSTDGGQTWQPLPDPTGSGVHRLVVDPGSTQRLLLSEYNRLFFSADGGQSYTEVFHPADDQMWLAGAFWDGQNIYVGTGKGLLVSHNGGQSFALESHAGLPAGSGIFQLSGAKQGATTRLFAVTATSADLYAWLDILDLENSLTGLYRLNYTANASWTNVRNNIPTGVQLNWVDLATNNTAVVYAAGGENDYPYIYKSTNGGNTWTNTFLIDNNQNTTTGWGGAYGAFSYEWGGAPLGFDVADNDPTVVIATDGFSHITTDGGATWRQLHVDPAYENAMGDPTPVDKFYKSSGLNVTTGHHLLWLNGQEMFAGSTDIGNQFSADGGQSWSFARNTFYPWGTLANPNWYTILERPDNHDLYAAVSNMNDAYLGYRLTDDVIGQNGGMVLHSADKGVHWDTLRDFGHPVVWLARDPQAPATLFASVVDVNEGGIYRSNDGGLTWARLPAPPRTEGHPYNIRLLNDGGMVASYSARALEDGQTLTPSSGVFYSPDGGDTWYDRTAPEMTYYTKEIVVDPNDLGQNTWYATVWGQFTVFPGPNNGGNGGLYRTTNRGLTWTRIFEHERAESITVHPQQPNVAYVTVEMEGLFYSSNLNAPQPDFVRVASFPYPRPKRVFFDPYHPGKLWVTTMGGSLWHGEQAPTPVSESAPETGQPRWALFPNPAPRQVAQLRATGLAAGGYELAVYDLLGRNTLQQHFDIKDGQPDAVNLYSLPPGGYFVKIFDSNGRFYGVQRLEIVR